MKDVVEEGYERYDSGNYAAFVSGVISFPVLVFWVFFKFLKQASLFFFHAKLLSDLFVAAEP